MVRLNEPLRFPCEYTNDYQKYAHQLNIFHEDEPIKKMVYYKAAIMPKMINFEKSFIMRLRLQKLWPVIKHYMEKYENSSIRILERLVFILYDITSYF